VLLEIGDRGAVEPLREPSEVGPRRRDLGHREIEAALQVEQGLRQRSRRGGPCDAEHRLRLVEIAERLHARVGLADASLAEERCVAAIAGARRDARGRAAAGRHRAEDTGRVGYARPAPRASSGVHGRVTMPTGRGEAKDKKAKKKSKEQLEKELRKKSVAQPVQPMTFEIVKPKRKEKESW